MESRTTARYLVASHSVSLPILFMTIALCARGQKALAQPPADEARPWQLTGFLDVATIGDFNTPSNHLFRNRGTTPRVDEVDVNMTAAAARREPSRASRWGVEATVHAGRDAETFGFSATAPNLDGAAWLKFLGPTNASYLAPIGNGLTVQGGIFSSLIGYDSLYAKDNFSYTRPWGADYTPYLMLGVNTSYPFSPNVTGTVGIVNGYFHLAHANDAPSVVGQVAVKAADRTSLKQTVLYGSHQSNTALEFWRVLSDTIVEHKGPRLTTAFEYQFGRETLDTSGRPAALWMSAQLPLHWTVTPAWSITVRPEAARDRDGRWIGAPQTVTALTTTADYRIRYRRTQTIVRVEHRIDHSTGTGGGFFVDRDGVIDTLTPTQHLLAVAAIFTFNVSNRE